MTPSFVRIVLAVVLVAAFGFAWRFFREAEDLRFDLRTAQSEMQTLKTTLGALQETAGRQELPARPPASAPADVPRTQPVKRRSEAEVRAQMQMRSEERSDALLASPTLQVLFEESRRGMYRAQFAALFQRMKLSPEQQTAFVSALASWDLTVKDLAAVMKEQGLPRNDPALKAQRTEADAKLMREVQAVLGPDAMTITREYTRFNHARSYVAGYGGLFSRLGQPLSFSQLESLVNAFGEAAPDKSPRADELTAAQWEYIEARAQSILTPEQRQIFQSTTSPGQTAGRWDSVANEALEQVAQGSGD